jgi:hypothetical protein
MKKFHLKRNISIALIVFITGCFFMSCKKPTTTAPSGPEVIVSTLAGGGAGSPATVNDPVYGEIGSANGLGTAASFYGPFGIVTDAAGNIYVGETFNHDIRKITPAGLVTTFAGSLTAGSADGIGTAASFSDFGGMAIDATGNIYVADSFNNLIRKITPAAVVSTIAGSGAVGAANGPAASASFNDPVSLAVDATGNVFVADLTNNVIRKITPGGMVSTFAGTGTRGYNNGAGANATFTSPEFLAADNAGNVYVSDFSIVRKITPDGVVSTLAGRSTPEIGPPGTIIDGKGTAASFAGTHAISVDAAGNIYVGDVNAIRKITPDGVATTLAGGGPGFTTDGIGNQASFGMLRGLTVNPAGNLIYLADFRSSLIRKVVIE